MMLAAIEEMNRQMPPVVEQPKEAPRFQARYANKANN